MIKLVDSQELLPLAIDLLKSGKETKFKVSGNSMRPFFKHQKTTVTLVDSNKQELKPYSVILYLENNNYKLHRAIKEKSDFWLVCGDALTEFETVGRKEILGIVVQHENKKVITATNKWYLFKVKLWYLLKPFRRVLLRIRFRR